jgi:hypothetical protein
MNSIREYRSAVICAKDTFCAVRCVGHFRQKGRVLLAVRCLLRPKSDRCRSRDSLN